jgi:hypothetical protein
VGFFHQAFLGGIVYQEKERATFAAKAVHAGDLDKVTLSSDTLRKYFPKSYTPAKMQETIIKLLEQWQKKRQRDQER